MRARWLGGSPLAMLGCLVVVSILVGVILAGVGLDPLVVVVVFGWLWRFFLLGAAFVVPFWLIVRLLNVLRATAPSKVGLEMRHFGNGIMIGNLQSLQMIEPETIKRLQIIGTALCVLVLGGLTIERALNPAPYDSQGRADLYYHPIASVMGALLPAVIAAPFAYWMFGRIFRRIAARYKVCEHCAETIKSDATICRYCGREATRNGDVAMALREKAKTYLDQTSDAAVSAATREQAAMIFDTALTFFAIVWLGLIAVLNLIAIIGFVITAPTLWGGISKVQEIYSPFNVWNWIVEVVALSPAVGAIVWRERRLKRRPLAP